MRRWEEHLQELMNKANEGEEVEQEVAIMSVSDIRRTLKRMKTFWGGSGRRS